MKSGGAFITSAAGPSGYPPEGPFEIAFAGRSNVGKSSLINMLLGKKAAAKISQSPGKTRTLNFYDAKSFVAVDLPGYGYAKVSKKETESWGLMIEGYLKNRKTLCGVVQLVDSRHAPTNLDIQMYEWLRFYGLSGIVAATKTDKLSKNELSKNLSVIKKVLNLNAGDKLIPVSAVTKEGLFEIGIEIKNLIEARKSDAPREVGI